MLYGNLVIKIRVRIDIAGFETYRFSLWNYYSVTSKLRPLLGLGRYSELVVNLGSNCILFFIFFRETSNYQQVQTKVTTIC